MYSNVDQIYPAKIIRIIIRNPSFLTDEANNRRIPAVKNSFLFENNT
jgi:hypothetical protein